MTDTTSYTSPTSDLTSTSDFAGVHGAEQRTEQLAQMLRTIDTNSVSRILSSLSVSALTIGAGAPGLIVAPATGPADDIENGLERLTELSSLAHDPASVAYLFDEAVPETVPREWLEEIDNLAGSESDFDYPWN